MSVSPSDWMKGIILSVTASVIGGASKLAIRKSWIMIENLPEDEPFPHQVESDDDCSTSNGDQDVVATTTTITKTCKTPPRLQDPNGVCQEIMKTIEKFPLNDQLSEKLEQMHIEQRLRSSTSEGKQQGAVITKPKFTALRTASISSSSSESSEMKHRFVFEIETPPPERSSPKGNYVAPPSPDEAAKQPNQNTPPPQCHKHQSTNCPTCGKHHRHHMLYPGPDGTFVPYPLNKSHSQADLQLRQWKHIQSTHRKSRLLRWSGMMGMTVFNPLCCVWAMNYASPSILAPFSGLTLVWIVLFSEYCVGERPLAIQVFAASLIIVGEVVVAVSGDHTNDEGVDMELLRESYNDPYFISFFFLLTLWMISMYLLIKYGTSSLQRFAWGVTGGSITGLQNFLKDGLTILKISPSFPPPIFYLFAILAISTSLSGLLVLTACMKRYDATYSSSMFVGSFVISASIMSAFHYQTFQNLERLWNYVFYPVGLLILLMGIMVLAKVPEGDKKNKVIVGMSEQEATMVRQTCGCGGGVDLNSTVPMDMCIYP